MKNLLKQINRTSLFSWPISFTYSC